MEEADSLCSRQSASCLHWLVHECSGVFVLSGVIALLTDRNNCLILLMAARHLHFSIISVDVHGSRDNVVIRKQTSCSSSAGGSLHAHSEQQFFLLRAPEGLLVLTIMFKGTLGGCATEQ